MYAISTDPIPPVVPPSPNFTEFRVVASVVIEIVLAGNPVSAVELPSR
jgi:hypothetical protein